MTDIREKEKGLSDTDVAVMGDRRKDEMDGEKYDSSRESDE